MRIVKHVVESIIVGLNGIVGEPVTDIHAARPLKHQGLATDLALVDVDRHAPRERLLRVHRCVKRGRIDFFARPAVEDLVEIFDRSSLDRDPGIVGGLGQSAHDRHESASQQQLFAVQRSLLKVVDEKADLAGERQQRVLELRHGRLGKRDMGRLEHMKAELAIVPGLPLVASARGICRDVARARPLRRATAARYQSTSPSSSAKASAYTG